LRARIASVGGGLDIGHGGGVLAALVQQSRGVGSLQMPRGGLGVKQLGLGQILRYAPAHLVGLAHVELGVGIALVGGALPLPDGALVIPRDQASPRLPSPMAAGVRAGAGLDCDFACACATGAARPAASISAAAHTRGGLADGSITNSGPSVWRRPLLRAPPGRRFGTFAGCLAKRFPLGGD
jgi:hypothetical protein